MPVRLTLAALTLGLLAAPAGADEPPQFNRHVTPVLYRLGCSAGSCHGAFAGKGGFRLSLFAGQPGADYAHVRGPLGRRVNPVRPEDSLLLLKPTGAVPHGGGLRLRAGSPEYRVLRDWIAAGARHDPAHEPHVLSLRVEPAEVIAAVRGTPGPLRVLARLSDGSEDEVTGFARFESLDPAVAAVDPDGRVTGERPGSVPVLAHYAGQVGFASVLVPGVLPPGVCFPEENLPDPVDRLLAAKLRRLNIVPSPPCRDEEFLRRVTLDATGLLPEPDAVRAFLADPDPDKRRKVIDRLLADSLHAALWAGKLCDMVGADDRFLGNRVYDFHDWFRNKLEANVPWDRIAYGVLCATAVDGATAEEMLAAQKRRADELRKLRPAKTKGPPHPRRLFQQPDRAEGDAGQEADP